MTDIDVPERLCYPKREGLTYEEHHKESIEKARASWRAIGNRPTYMVRTATGTIHALRSEPRGYGKRRREWERTTECGLMFAGLTSRNGAPTCRLITTTCLACRTVVRERYEMWCEYDDPLADEAADEYERLQIEEMWRIQAEWHKPDPLPEPGSFNRGDRVRHPDYGVGTVIAAAAYAGVLVGFDVRPNLPKKVDPSTLTEIGSLAAPLWAIPADLNYSLIGG